ncbi:hypothetical protein [Bradyrhizobium sp. CCGUVB23]|uniref:hypothetical protein n=1 Tax=Bradyrhizobium sp. CCGUVB23 TaxID=2949630 RepID=UPI0020B37C20|nr:hypothetical protein [Bradyrhizobium sp. CCGUVB23]MCP3459327.1 hypothetical protein [Bradyrhizobium sp. CCGUVB23]
MIGPVIDAMSVQHDGFDVAAVDINLRGRSAFPIADELMRVGKPFIFTTGYGAENIPDRFQHVRRWEIPYDLEEFTADVAELCRSQLHPLLAV